MDLALDPVTGDLMLPVQLVYGASYTRQAVQIRLRFFLGEWFLDQSAGIPYYEQIFIKQQNAKAKIDAIFKAAIVGTPTIQSLQSFTSQLVNREYSAAWSAISDFGIVGGAWPV